MLKMCVGCGKKNDSVERRQRSTVYEDNESNFIECCKECYDIEEEYWKDRWDDYNHSRL